MTDSPNQSPSVALTLTGLRDLYFYLGQIATIATDQRDALKPMIIALIGDKKELMTPDGWTFEIQERISREYDKAVLRKYFDEDMLDQILKPDAKKVKEIIKSIGLPTKTAEREIEDTMVVTGTSKALKLNPPTKETMGVIRKS